MSSTNRESDKFMLRLPNGMRDRIKAAAEANQRSMNAEIVASLREKYPAPPPDEEVEGIIRAFQELPEEVQKKFINDYVSSHFSDEDIADGLMAGVVLAKE